MIFALSLSKPVCPESTLCLRSSLVGLTVWLTAHHLSFFTLPCQSYIFFIILYSFNCTGLLSACTHCWLLPLFSFFLITSLSLSTILCSFSFFFPLWSSSSSSSSSFAETFRVEIYFCHAPDESERERESQSVVQSKVWDGFGSLVVHTSRLCVADIRKSEGEADLADSCKPLPKVFFSLSLFVSRAEVNCSFILINCRRRGGGRRRRRKRGDLWFGTLWFREAVQLLGRFLIRLLCFGQKQKFLGQFFRLPPSQLS